MINRVLVYSAMVGVAMSCAAQTGPALTPEQQAKLPSRLPLELPARMPVQQFSAETQAQIDADLLEIDIPTLQAMYEAHKHSPLDVTLWYITRIARYNSVYRPVQTLDWVEAIKTAKLQSAEMFEKSFANRGPLWGVPVLIKANTAVKGLIDTDGWQGFAQPGRPFIAQKDATVVARLRAAGAILLGITNMPDFAASDTNRSTAFGRTGNAYDVRFSPGGSSGGTVTAITENLAMFGTGTDTANSIRMPAGTSSVVGMLPTRGLVSIAGIAPLDWLRDNTGPIARNVTDAALALSIMAGEDPAGDFRTAGSAAKAQPGPYTRYLKKDALKGKRFGVPWFIFTTMDDVLRPETRAMLMQSIAAVKAAGAEVVIDPTLLPQSFLENNRKIQTRSYLKDGADQWLAAYGPRQFKTAAEFTAFTGIAWPSVFSGERRPGGVAPAAPQPQVKLATDPDAEAKFYAPQRASLAEYTAALDQFHLDGLLYPSAQMPPPDETMPQDGQLSGGPHSETGWVNRLGVPAIVVPAGFYPSGLPFGLEISARPWRDGDLLGWAYAFEQATKSRRPPVLVESGLPKP